MLKRRAARVVTTGLLLAVPVLGLTACRTSPNVAAYVGDDQVTVAELDRAVEDRTSDETIAAFAEDDRGDFTRRVLTVLVQEKVYAEAAERYGVEVDGDDVRAEIDAIFGGQDPDEVYATLAEQGVGRADVLAGVRQRLIGQRIAEAEGRADELGVDALRARYEEVKEQFAQYSFGFITVADQATADSILAQLTAAPASYPALAAQYPGRYTLPNFQVSASDQLPEVLAEGIAGAEPGSGFTTAVPEAGGVVVTFVDGVAYQPFAEVRPQLEQQAAETVQQAAVELVSAVQDDLGVTVNPRFGELDGSRIVAGEGGVVDILEDEVEDQAGAAEAGE